MHKFYNYMSGDVRDRIDEMKNRIDFVTPSRQAEFPYLSILLEAATDQKVLRIDYESKGQQSCRAIQPVGIYASSGLWYCPAYCFVRGDIRVFRCDRIHSADYDHSGLAPLDLRHIHLGNKEIYSAMEQVPEEERVKLHVELGKAGSRAVRPSCGRHPCCIGVKTGPDGWKARYLEAICAFLPDLLWGSEMGQRSTNRRSWWRN